MASILIALPYLQHMHTSLDTPQYTHLIWTGIARGAGLVLFEVLRGANDGGAPPSALQLVGYSASVLGFVAYTGARLSAPPKLKAG